MLPSFDESITIPQSMDAEVERLQVLKGYEILDTEREELFDRLTRLASRLFQVPIALVSIVDLARQWFKSSVGLEASETTRRVAFCSRKINCHEKHLHSCCSLPSFLVSFQIQL